jgi:hypothetical protein
MKIFSGGNGCRIFPIYKERRYSYIQIEKGIQNIKIEEDVIE